MSEPRENNLNDPSTNQDPAAGSLSAAWQLQQLTDAFALALVRLSADDEWNLPGRLCYIYFEEAKSLEEVGAFDGVTAFRPGEGDVVSMAYIDLTNTVVLEGHPFEALVGSLAPPACDGAALVIEGWARSASSDVQEREEVRIVTVLLRNGESSTHIAPRNGVSHPSGNSGGRVPDALRRHLALPTEIPAPALPEVRTRLLVAALLDTVERADLARLRTARSRWLSLIDGLPSPLCYLGRDTWRDVRVAALDDPHWSKLASWADDSLWAREMDDQVPGTHALARRLAAYEIRNGELAAEQLDADVRRLLEGIHRDGGNSS